MAVDASTTRQNYTIALQRVAAKVLELQAELNRLDALYQGAGLSGTFVDAELLSYTPTKHLAAADIGTYTANFNTIRTAITTNIAQNMAKAVGSA